MKPPQVIRLGYRDITVKKSGTLASEECGHFDFVKGIIAINTGQRPHDEANTVIHELIHVMLRLSSDPILEDEKEEERLVTVLANQFTELWRRNPELILYLDACLGGE